MVDNKPANLFLWVVLTVAAMFYFGVWGFALALIGGLVWLHEFDKEHGR